MERLTTNSLALGQASAAQQLLSTLPSGIAMDENDELYHAAEHESFRRLFAVFACHEAVEEVQSRAPKST
jgi:hypothetical protein